MARIYTKTGDAGETRLFDGTTVAKSDPRVAAYGDVDELNAVLGVARAALEGEAATALDEALGAIQRELFAVGSLLADPRRDGREASGDETDERTTVTEDDVRRLEQWIDTWEEQLTPLKQFVLPAGTPAAAALHHARTVARRAERAVVDLVVGGGATPTCIRYLNRVSDLLFVAARLANQRAGVDDVPW